MGSILGRLLGFVFLPFVVAFATGALIAKFGRGKNELNDILLAALSAGFAGMFLTTGVALSTDTAGSLSAFTGKIMLLLGLVAAALMLYFLFS